MVASREQPRTFAEILELFKLTYQDWTEDKAPRLGAALAYYAIFSLSPLLVVVISVAGIFFGEEAARGEISGQITRIVGSHAAEFIESMLASTRSPSSSILATIIGVLTLLMGAMGVFGQLQDAMNTIWEIEPQPKQSFLQNIKDRLTPFVVLMGAAFLMLVSLSVNAAIIALANWASGYLPLPPWLLQMLNLAISLAIVTGLFALIFRVLPDAEIHWHDVWIGSFMTAVLFTIGQLALAWYIGRTSGSSTYGAAGSLVAVLVWIYWASQILFFGAEFTQVYANKYGSRLLPDTEAESSARDISQQAAEQFMARPTPPTSNRVKTPPRQPSRNELMEDWGAILAGLGIAFILHRIFRRGK